MMSKPKSPHCSLQKSLTSKAAVSCFCGIDGAMVRTNRDDQTVRLLLSIQNQMSSFEALRSRIAASRGSAFVKNYGWLSRIRFNSQSRHRALFVCFSGEFLATA